MLSLYRFHMKDGTTREASGNSEKESAYNLGINPKLYESYEILPGKSLTQVEEVKEAPMEVGEESIERIKAQAAKDGISATGLSPKKERKPRADTGKKREKKADVKSPDKPKKRPMVYHLVDGTVTTFETKELLDEALSMAPDTVILRVIAGGKLHQVECQKRFILSK